MPLIAQTTYLELVDRGIPVTPPKGLVYSSAPRSSLGKDGHEYITKGPDPNIVVPEALGYLLAAEVGLRVPDFGFARIGDDPPLFATRKVPHALRDVIPFVGVDFLDDGFFAMLAAFDMWVANTDRNAGNLIGQEIDNSLRIFAIDFGRAMALHAPVLLRPDVKPRDCRPHDLAVETFIRQHKGVAEAANRIQLVPRTVIASYIDLVARFVSEFSWGDHTLKVLLHRQRDLLLLLQEVWK